MIDLFSVIPENVQTDLFGNIVYEDKKLIDRELLAKQLYNIFKDISLNEFVRLLTNEFNEIIEYAKLSNGQKTCQKTSLLFNPHRLNIIAGISEKSIFEAMKDARWMRGLARVVLLNSEKVNELLYQSIQLGINGVQYANEFPPHVARDIYLKYNMNKDSKILDPCAGWGGRMIGASIVSDHYTCFEPSTETYKGLMNLFLFIQKLSPSFSAFINCKPFEDSELVNNTYDIAITSPPYYDTEQYSEEETNSLNRYNTYQKWCEYFYLPLVQKTMDALKSGSVFVMNIGSRKYDLNEVLKSNFEQKYQISKLKDYLSNTSGLNKKGEGETFYTIRK